MILGFFGDNTSWLNRTILILIALSFVMGFGYFGVINLTNTGVSTGTAAEVNGEKIPLVQFYNVRENLYDQFGEGLQNIPPEAMQFFNVRALQQLVEAKLLAQKAQQLGFTVSDDELSESIRTNPSFQQDGKFIGLDNYRNLIRQALNMSVGDFEKGYKEELLVQKVVELINNSAKITDDELFNLYKVENENINLYYISFEPGEFGDSAEISDGEISEYYDKNKDKFLTDEERRIDYIKVNQADFEKNIPISDDEVDSYYSSYGDEFKDEEGNVKQLADVKDEIVGNLRKKRVGSIYDNFVNTVTRSDSIDPLDKLVAENTLSPATSSEFFTAKQETEVFPIELRNKAFTINANEVSAYNYRGDLWVFEVKEIKEQSQKSLDDAKEDIISTLKNAKGSEAAKIAADESLKKLLGNNSTSFRNLSKSFNLDVKESGLFTRAKAPAELNVEDLKLDAFLLSKSSPTAKKIYKSGDSFYIISLKERKDVSKEQFDREKDTIMNQQLSRQRGELLSAWIDTIRNESEIVPNPNLISSNN